MHGKQQTRGTGRGWDIAAVAARKRGQIAAEQVKCETPDLATG